MKRLLTSIFLTVAILLAISPSYIFADGPAPADPSLVISPGKVIMKQAQQNVSKKGSKRVAPSASVDYQVGSFSIRYSNGVQLGFDGGGNKFVRHYLARTEALSSSGSYQTEAHATLLNGGDYGDSSVFDSIQNACAEQVVNNNAAQTCSSPWFATSTGRPWYIVSGHYFDIGIDGTQDSTCPGCIDWIYYTQ